MSFEKNNISVEFEAVVAALNDKQSLNKQALLHLLTSFLREKSTGKAGFREVVRFFHDVSSTSDTEYQRIASKSLDYLNDVEIGMYIDYIKKMDDIGAIFSPFYSNHYPNCLWNIEKPPLALYIKGDPESLQNGIAIVGTRKAKEHRTKFVRQLSRILVNKGYRIISGLANGIDEAAHNGALDAKGQTVAVLPGDIEKIRPASNRSIGEKIPENGALVSEVSDEVSIHRGRFVKRNRITSGISKAIVIGASGETGGTIHQAHFAEEQKIPRYLFESDRNDGQSPEKLDNLGFIRFKNPEELLNLIKEEWEENESTSRQETTLEDFSV